MHKEILSFKVGLSGTSSLKSPDFKICVDGKTFCEGSLSTNPNETEYFEFPVEILEGEHSLEVHLLNKHSTDTIKDDTGQILEDMLLNIDSIEIDEIEIGVLKWTASSYFPEYPSDYLDETQKSIKEVKNCVNLGWNGVWKIQFTSPFYIWLLENI